MGDGVNYKDASTTCTEEEADAQGRSVAQCEKFKKLQKGGASGDGRGKGSQVGLIVPRDNEQFNNDKQRGSGGRY